MRASLFPFSPIGKVQENRNQLTKVTNVQNAIVAQLNSQAEQLELLSVGRDSAGPTGDDGATTGVVTQQLLMLKQGASATTASTPTATSSSTAATCPSWANSLVEQGEFVVLLGSVIQLRTLEGYRQAIF